MKKRIFALICAAMMTGMCCVSCGDSDSGRKSGSSHRSERIDDDDNVPSKSAIQATCAEAKTVATAAYTAITELEEEGTVITLNGWYDHNGGNASDDEQWKIILERMAKYADCAEDGDFSVYISQSCCKGVVCKNKKNVAFGIYPVKLTSDNYEELLGKNPDFDDAKAAAEKIMTEEGVVVR